jgi:hypothetical protein
MNIIKIFQKPQVQKPHNYDPIVPSGLIAHTEKGYFYIKDKKRFKFVSDRAMQSWNLPIIETKEFTMTGIISGGILGFRDGTLVQDISDGKIYLISDSKRRHVIDPDVLEWLDSKIVKIGQKELFVHSEGEKL